jgi:hypothetical protein
MSKMCPKVILEGTRLTFKTEIAFSLNEHPRVVGPRKYRYHSPLISAEWCVHQLSLKQSDQLRSLTKELPWRLTAPG